VQISQLFLEQCFDYPFIGAVCVTFGKVSAFNVWKFKLFELRDMEIAKIEEFEFPNVESRDFAKSDANRTNERIVEALFEKELRNLHKRKMKDDEKLSESELEDMNFSDFSYNEIDEELPDTKN
jgi:hypothetical protein